MGPIEIKGVEEDLLEGKTEVCHNPVGYGLMALIQLRERITN